MFINVFNCIIFVAKIANKNNKQYINLKMFFNFFIEQNTVALMSK